MSRYNPDYPSAPEVFAAARLWRDRCFVEDGSALSDENLWTEAHVQELIKHFVQRPDAGEGPFLSKLGGQLIDASPGAKRLMSEFLWLLNLFPSGTHPPAKRDQVVTAWAWSGTRLDPDTPQLSDPVLSGLGSAGPGYNNHRWRELRYLTNLAAAAKALPRDERDRISRDPWVFDAWVDAIPDEGGRQLKLILPHLVFPDEFERIASSGAVSKILRVIGEVPSREAAGMTKVERDRALLELRNRLEAEAGEPIDFYRQPYKDQWDPQGVKEPPPEIAPQRASNGAPKWVVPPLNQILYGPPGTGKTYRTIDRALRILDPDFLEKNQSERLILKERFDELVAGGQIAFVTFHQSLSYEDFVEGLRADVDANGQLRYVVADGIFKRFCLSGGAPKAFEPGAVFSREYKVSRSTLEILWLQKPNGSDLPLPWAILNELRDMVASDQISIEDIRRGTVFDRAPDSRLERYIVNGYKNILPLVVDALIKGSGSPGALSGRRVLIIDEINRGNVSRIFGELITLIEDNKRAGAPEALSVTLPYSKTSFQVPDTVHLIGTMNTADRSLAAMDIALRRRFVFEEVEPDPGRLDDIELEGVNVGQLLAAINGRIELLLDRDHRVGHAYFMRLETATDLADLSAIFANSILPLLQEYFFDDWRRISLVLNDHRKDDAADRFFIRRETLGEDLFGAGDLGAPLGASWTINKDALVRRTAYLGTIG